MVNKFLKNLLFSVVIGTILISTGRWLSEIKHNGVNSQSPILILQDLPQWSETAVQRREQARCSLDTWMYHTRAQVEPQKF